MQINTSIDTKATRIQKVEVPAGTKLQRSRAKVVVNSAGDVVTVIPR